MTETRYVQAFKKALHNSQISPRKRIRYFICAFGELGRLDDPIGQVELVTLYLQSEKHHDEAMQAAELVLRVYF